MGNKDHFEDDVASKSSLRCRLTNLRDRGELTPKELDYLLERIEVDM